MRGRLFSVATVFSIFTAGFLNLERALGGECKLKNPLISVVANAVDFSSNELLRLRFDLDQAYMSKHKKPISLYLLARAGQDPDRALIINNRDSDGQPISATRMVNKASSDDGKETDSSNFFFAKKGTTESVAASFKSRFLKPPGEDKMVYSHAGFLYDSNYECLIEGSAGGAGGGWCMQHMLKPCMDEDVPELDGVSDYSVPNVWYDSISGFYSDDPKEVWGQVVVPVKWLQDSLIEVLQDRKLFQMIKGSHYNVLAKWDNSHGTDKNWLNLTLDKIRNGEDEQNSNGWILEVVALAAARYHNFPIKNRADIIAFLKKTRYAPSLMLMDSKMAATYGQLGSLPLINKVMPDIIIHRKEQPELSFYAVGEVVTVNSIIEWIEINGWLEVLKGKTKHEAKLSPERDYRNYEKHPKAKQFDEFFMATIRECRAKVVPMVKSGVIDAEFAKGPKKKSGDPMSRMDVFNDFLDKCSKPILDPYYKKNGGGTKENMNFREI